MQQELLRAGAVVEGMRDLRAAHGALQTEDARGEHVQRERGWRVTPRRARAEPARRELARVGRRVQRR